MARRSGILYSLAQFQRAQAQAAAAQIRAQSAAAREAERTRRAYERARTTEDKERRRLYVEARSAEVEEKNAALIGYVAALEGVLQHTLGVDDYFDLDKLKDQSRFPAFEPGPLGTPKPEPAMVAVPPLKGVQKLVPGAGAKHATAVAAAEQAHRQALAEHHAAETERQAKLAAARKEHEAKKAELEAQQAQQHAEVEDFKRNLAGAEPDAIRQYFGLVLETSSYPEGFPQQFRLGFIPESKQLVIEYELPGFTIVPDAASHRYVKSKDEITSPSRPVSQRRVIYASVIAQLAIRTLHEVFEADRTGFVDSAVFNGHVSTVDPATGQPIRPCLVTVRTSHDVFKAIDLANVDPIACLKGLNASVSRSPSELAPVRPVLDFSMVDPRFIEEQDVLSGLDQRPNLMELTPGEFESLITNLFDKMGLETKLTQASRDGGVDCVAYDPRPILGGKVIIQAKRYKNTVGVSAVRDLFGTVHNEGASKGILITTSGYGKASFEFAEGKPLELLSGSNLLYLLEEHAGIKARIEPPEDWQDPISGV